MAEAGDNKALAAAEKALGTTAYKAKDFETAIKHYNAATELDDTDMTFHLNLAAVHLQKKDFEACIASCTKAAEIGMDNRADYKMQAKAAARAGKCYLAMGDLENALKYYDRALTNDRNKDYLTAKKKVQVAIKEKKRLEYIDPELADAAKGKGTEHVKKGEYPDAIKEYTEAIERNPDDAAFTSRCYSNRAMCYTKLTALPHALKDAEKTIELDPAWVKGYLRKANCLIAMQKTQEAVDVYNEALKVAPDNAEARQGIQNAYRARAQAQAGMSQEERAAQAMKDPEVQQILNDPVVNNILQEAQKDPGSLATHMQNPEIKRKIEKLVESGILQVR